MKTTASILNRDRADTRPALEAVERGINAITQVPQINPEADQYRKVLLDLLNEQKSILTDLTQSGSESRNTVGRREDALNERYIQFTVEYNRWLPGFLNEHGYELESGDK